MSMFDLTIPDLPPLPVRHTVLCVDDQASMLELVVRILSRENYHLLSARSGADALQVVTESGLAPDLLITDFLMPGINGRELAWQLRQRSPGLKVLYQTGHRAGLLTGRDIEPNSAYIEKPFSARVLIEEARKLLFGTIAP